ncbi:Membrane protein ptm1 [Yamadazyma tenuis]|uniref:Membrane protein PTM1 n=1 Tax=Candida tenuis (strain ATCC 10573 / BCRC 21748 / CBS 615 / JCM 9827 / NBRC 10315 / NRRL Y-1498 / VKM Y-70) TaxID=590646 RepID=G3AYH1_CANTC|nr:uncharacterized protein CANTEDRAFT_112723 [Yamadazyma tenuis ATCC 10573]EGV65851.1 hypothetical protein CANTEDRAFT_112723 [Yamadazyma tenuis ATCC 10573]WEJ95820.1 Membrane protein ptm1 [Yamadazyma tenuis]
MKVLIPLLLVCQLLLGCAANRAVYDDSLNSQVCVGMYSKHDWGGSYKPQINLKLSRFGKDKYKKNKKISEQPHTEDIKMTYIIFEYQDFHSIGYHFDDGQVKYICDDTAINSLGICDQKQKGKFIINNNSTKNTILTNQLTHLGQANFSYPINETGFYCVSTFVEDETIKYNGIINFQNAFGQLSASEIPKLPAYGILTLLYAIAIGLFGFQFFKKRKANQILPLQRYLLAMLGLLTFDTLVVWSYYDLLNRSKNPSSGFVIFYMAFLSILNSLKLTFSFFLLLCIALGYGVVVVKLDKKIMLKCKILAGFHFVASLLYLFSSYYNDSVASINSTSSFDDDSSDELLALLPLIPVTVTLCIYYAMILISIKKTTANLNKQRQVIKLKLYESLFRIIFLSFFLTFAGILVASFIFLSMSTTQLIEQSWKSTFFIFEFAPSVIYFIIFMGIAWLWRPTETSYMLAVSQQLSTEENDENNAGTGFELDDLSLLSHSDDEDARVRERDSFELREDVNGALPPSYESAQAHDHHQPVERTDSNTLFELGDESDEEDRHSDDRLRGKNQE